MNIRTAKRVPFLTAVGMLTLAVLGCGDASLNPQVRSVSQADESPWREGGRANRRFGIYLPGVRCPYVTFPDYPGFYDPDPIQGCWSGIDSRDRVGMFLEMPPQDPPYTNLGSRSACGWAWPCVQYAWNNLWWTTDRARRVTPRTLGEWENLSVQLPRMEVLFDPSRNLLAFNFFHIRYAIEYRGECVPQFDGRGFEAIYEVDTYRQISYDSLDARRVDGRCMMVLDTEHYVLIPSTVSYLISSHETVEDTHYEWR